MVAAPMIHVPHASLRPEAQRLVRGWVPATELGAVVRRCFRHLPSDLALELYDRIRSAVILESRLYLVHVHGPQSDTPGRRDDHGLVSYKVVTDNGVALIVDAFDNTVTTGDCRYHGLGTGTTAEAANQTALVTELTTQYNPDNTRATGTFSQPSANVSQSVATNTLDASANVAEHAPFTQAATGGGTMLDRSQFTALPLVSGDSLQSTYQISFASGG